MESARVAYEPQWRQVCTKFYFHKDAAAKRVLDCFETSRADGFKSFGPHADEVWCVGCVNTYTRGAKIGASGSVSCMKGSDWVWCL